jgi:hypothetical protein
MYPTIATHKGFDINSVYEIFKGKYQAFTRQGCLNLQAAKDLIDLHIQNHKPITSDQPTKEFSHPVIDLYDQQDKHDRFEKGMNGYYERESNVY